MDKLNIIVDTREQKPLWVASNRFVNITNTKLDVGDYSLQGFENVIAIERKGPMDAFSTLGQSNNHARFNAEWERAKNLKYFAVIIELSVGDMYHKNFENSFRTRIHGNQMVQTWITHSLKRGYHLFFVNNCDEARLLVKCLFKSFLANFVVETGRFKL
jgi:ERCC4-type nuclease